MSDDFVVNDKRLFSKDGQMNQTAAEEEKAAPKMEGPPEKTYGEEDETLSMPLPPANLASLMVGLATSALIHLGESPDPETGPGAPNFPAAQHAIDLLAVLQEKTTGNLIKEEEALLQTLLYDLRMKYVQATGAK